MKKQIIPMVVALTLFVPAVCVRAQSPLPVQSVQPAAAATPDASVQIARELADVKAQMKQATEALLAMRQVNQQLIEKQRKTLTMLDALLQDAEQIRIISSRK